MPEIVADPLLPSCYHLFSRSGIEESQQRGPDPSLPRARGARTLRQGQLQQPAGPYAWQDWWFDWDATAVGRHSEIVDPFRSDVPGEATCGGRF